MLGHRKLGAEDYLDILRRRKWILAIPLLLMPIVAITATFFIPARYVSQTLVLIEGQQISEAYVKAVTASDLDSRLASMQQQILSRSRIQPIIERYNLYGNTKATMDERVDRARHAIVIKPVHSEIANSGGLPGFIVAFTAPDAHTAQLVCSEITSLFLSENQRAREASTEGTTDFLKSQLSDAKRSLDEQDAKLAAFQHEYGGKLPGEEGANVGMLGSLNTQLEAANQALAQQQQNRTYMESMLAQQVQATQPAGGPAQSGGGGETVSQIGTPAQQAELQSLTAQESELLNHYTPDYPDVVTVRRKLVDLRKAMQPVTYRLPGSTASAPPPVRESLALQQLRSSIKAVDLGIEEKKKEQAGIQANIGVYQERIASSPMVQEQYKELTRDYQTALSFYNSLLAKTQDSKMATDLEKRQEGEQFRIMDQPNLPDGPTFPNRVVFAFGGIAAGLFLGCGIVAMLEYKNTALRSERDVWAFTKLPTLAVVSYADPRKTSSLRANLSHRLRSFSKKQEAH